MNQDNLNDILTKHRKWLYGEEDGERADLQDANLRGANLRRANLRDADLRDADLRGVCHDSATAFLPIQCPEEGAFIAYKKAHGLIVKLLVPDDAKRSSATSRKCRCDKAKVLEILEYDRTKADVTSVSSNYDPNFLYEIGKTVEVENFADDRFIECAAGIHFFITFDEAKEY